MLLNPAFIYAATWSFVLLLYLLGLSYLLEPLRSATVVLVIGTSLAFIIGWLLESLPSDGRLATLQTNAGLLESVAGDAKVQRRIRMLWWLFGLGFGFEIVLFGGLPLPGMLGIGANLGYTEFGVHGFHGLLNAIFFAVCIVKFTEGMLNPAKKPLKFALLSFLYPVMCMSRQVLISLLVQYFFVYFSIKRPSPRVFLRAGAVFCVMLLAFGYLGDLRSGREHIIEYGQPAFEYPEWLPSAFIWFYIYLCTPLNNVNYNIDIKPSYFPLETAQSLIPSFARDSFVSAVGGTKQWDLVNETFNVSSLLQALLSDFGVGGAIAFTLFWGIIFARLLRRAGSVPAAYFAIIVILHGVSLSFFANMLFHLIFVFEILTVTWILSGSRRLKRT